MFDHTLHSGLSAVAPHRILKMVRNERMGGYVPKWEAASSSENSPKNQVEQALAAAKTAQPGTITDTTLAYQPPTANAARQEEFTFGDLIDMVNPLQHIPLVGSLYRAWTGDTIKSISQIVGGALFGGPFGAAAGMANAVVQEETGQDIAQNIVDKTLRRGHKPAPADPAPSPLAYSPAQDLPGTVIALADLKADHNYSGRYNA